MTVKDFSQRTYASKVTCKCAYFCIILYLTLPRETALLCCKVAVSTANLQLKQFNGNFDTCICLVHLLPLYTCTSKMIMDLPGLWVYRIRIFNAEKRDNEQLKEYINALFKDNFSL